MVPFERDIPRFPSHEDPRTGLILPAEPKSPDLPDERKINLMLAASDLYGSIADYVTTDDHRKRKDIVDKLEQIVDPSTAAIQVHMTLDSLYKNPQPDQKRKKSYQQLYKQLVNKAGETVYPRSFLIDEVFSSKGIDSIGKIPGIRFIQETFELPEFQDCFQYAFGYGHTQALTLHDFLQQNYLHYRKAAPYEPGSIVLYWSVLTGYYAHAGRITNNGRVISKWGEHGHVFEHDAKDVLTLYGNAAEFIKEK